MRPAYFMLALAMTACSIRASAADVDFELGSSLFEQATAAPEVVNFAGSDYDHPLYEGLWSMTLKAFCDSDVVEDKEVFSFSIAASDTKSLRSSFLKATRDKFEELEAIYVFGGIAFSR